MSKEADIQAFLQDRSIGPALVARLDESSQTAFIEASTATIGERADDESASKYQLVRLAQEIRRRFSVRVVLLYRAPPEYSEVEARVRDLLTSRWQDSVSDAHLSFQTQDKAFARITAKQQLSPTNVSELSAAVRDLLAEIGITLTGTEYTRPIPEAPPIAAILRAVKTLAPAKIENIVNHLQSRGFDRPTERSIRNALDTARKQGLVIWQQPGSYILTAQGLDFVPHTKTRSSSDVERILLLGKRRKW